MNTMKPLLMTSCLLIQACASMGWQENATTMAAGEIEQARSLVSADWPQDKDTRLTTSGAIYLANLDSQITTLEHLLAQRPADIFLTRLALAYYHRFQIVGRLEDAEHARWLLQDAVKRAHQPAVDLAYAQVLLGFHEFELANNALDVARSGGANPDTVNDLQQAVDRATGARIEDSSYAFQANDTQPTPAALVTLAAEMLERGHTAEASRLLKSAQDNYQDTAPYLLAWIQVQQGIVFLRHQEYETAAIFFNAAHQRFPQYTLATEHLAEAQLALGNYQTAAALYRDVSEQTANPEFLYRLALAERAMGMNREADLHAQTARDRYVDRVARHPAMFADHAARYFLDSGSAEIALDLAHQNILLRRDIRARTLLLETELVAGNEAAACNELRAIQSLGFAPPELPNLAGQLPAGCSL